MHVLAITIVLAGFFTSGVWSLKCNVGGKSDGAGMVVSMTCMSGLDACFASLVCSNKDGKSVKTYTYSCIASTYCQGTGTERTATKGALTGVCCLTDNCNRDLPKNKECANGEKSTLTPLIDDCKTNSTKKCANGAKSKSISLGLLAISLAAAFGYHYISE